MCVSKGSVIGRENITKKVKEIKNKLRKDRILFLLKNNHFTNKHGKTKRAQNFVNLAATPLTKLETQLQSESL